MQDTDRAMARAEEQWLQPPEPKEEHMCRICGDALVDEPDACCEECQPYYECGDEFVLLLYQNIPERPYDADLILYRLIDLIHERAVELCKERAGK